LYHEDSEELQAILEAEKKAGAAYETVKTELFGWTLTQIEIYKLDMSPSFGLVVTEERVLRQNYQLDIYGNPERLPEFEFA
jgi:hypothetical protein